jgi:hypothetical protein
LGCAADQIIGEKHGGPTDADNLAYACVCCNLHKGPNIAGIDPLSGNLSRLFHPRRDLWPDHFTVFGAEIIGANEIGRTTVEVLAMNDETSIIVRSQLITERLFLHSTDTD